MKKMVRAVRRALNVRGFHCDAGWRWVYIEF